MWKLIKLEWKKNNILKYMRNAAIMTGILLIFIIAAAGELETAATVEVYDRSMLSAAVELFVHMSYIIFTGVMLAAFVVGAYEKKTINLMFTYPIRRQRILLSQIAAVWIFNFAVMVLSKLLICGALLLTRPFTHISAADIRFGDISFWVDILLGSAAMVSISYIALPVGLKMRSSRAAIVAAVIIVCFTQGNIGTFTLVNNMLFYALLLAAAVAAVFLSVHNVETRDVI